MKSAAVSPSVSPISAATPGVENATVAVSMNATPLAPFVFQFDDTTNASALACVFAPEGLEVCQFVPPGGNPGGIHYIPAGPYAALHLNLTWRPASPTAAALRITLYEENEAFDQLCGRTAMTSPFLYDCDLEKHNATTPMLLYIHPAPLEPDAANAYVYAWAAPVPQPFHVEGRFVPQANATLPAGTSP